MWRSIDFANLFRSHSKASISAADATKHSCLCFECAKKLAFFQNHEFFLVCGQQSAKLESKQIIPVNIKKWFQKLIMKILLYILKVCNWSLLTLGRTKQSILGWTTVIILSLIISKLWSSIFVLVTTCVFVKLNLQLGAFPQFISNTFSAVIRFHSRRQFNPFRNCCYKNGKFWQSMRRSFVMFLLLKPKILPRGMIKP